MTSRNLQEPEIAAPDATQIEQHRAPDQALDQAASRKRSGGGSYSLLHLAERYTLPVMLLLLTLGTWVVLPRFGTVTNLQALLSSQSVLLVLAIGMIVPLLAGNFDLSIGAIASLSSILSAILMTSFRLPLVLALLAGLLVALGLGLLNGWLVAFANLDALIATLGTSIVMLGLISWVTNDLSVTGLPKELTHMAITAVAGIPLLAIIAIAAAIVIGYLIGHTPFGRRLTAIGSSREAAHLIGIRVRRNMVASFVVAAALGWLAGVMLLAQQGSGNPAVNPISLILPALAAVYLGASTIQPGQFNVPGTIVGLLLVAVIVSGLTLAGVNSWVQSVVTGLALIIAVGTSTAFRKRRIGIR